MNPINPSDTVVQDNARSLSILSRAIRLAQNQFALILVRCNYDILQERMGQALHQKLADSSGAPLPLAEVDLPPSTATLFTTLLTALEEDQTANFQGGGEKPPEPLPSQQIAALMVFGLDAVTELDRVLVATNQVREEFRKHFSFPIVLWATDEVLQKLTRFAPDFKSWASAAIKFDLTQSESIQLWWQTTDRFFQALLAGGADRFISNAELGLAPGQRDRREFEFTRRGLLGIKTSLSPIIEAIWQFVLGRDAYGDGQSKQALTHYQQSLNFWLQGTGYWELEIDRWSIASEQVSITQTPLIENIANPFLEQKGLLLFHIGLCHCHNAHQKPAQSHYHWQQARICFSAALEIFAVKNHPDWVAQLTVQLGKVLQQLEDWSELQVLTLHSLTQPATANSCDRKARAYGFLTQVALARQADQEAKCLALKAYAIQKQSLPTPPQPQALYLFLLAKAQHQLGENAAAIDKLEQAKGLISSEIKSQPGETHKQTGETEQLYLEILEALRSLYFRQHQYEAAFDLKQEQQFIEQVYGLRAFYGVSPLTYPNERSQAVFEAAYPIAPPSQQEILASGRQQDVDGLLERLRRSEHKLTIVHGSSGVGKSSLLRAGLVPALWGEIIAAREVMPVIQATYNDWEQGFSRAFIQGLKVRQLKTDGSQALPPFLSSQTILEGLRGNPPSNLLTVLIFDQFEEFFFHCPQSEERQAFYQFLRDCLSIPFVKVILCLREDHLHELLTLEREMDCRAIDNDLLDRQIRYALEDLTGEEARRVIKLLTERSHFHLEEALIDRLVKDIASLQGTVRPIELQVVGAALQAEKITTLGQYQQLGSNPKTVLVERWLQGAIADCGPDNEEAVWQVLFALTDAKGLRPLKTKAELLNAGSDRAAFKPERKKAKLHAQIDLILKILIGSGLVFRLREETEDRYQLVHTYLVQRIRKQYSERASKVLATQLKSSKVELLRVRKQRIQALAVGGVCALSALMAAYLSFQAETQRRLATIISLNAELMALSSSSEALFASNQQFEALLEGLRAAKKLDASQHGPRQQWLATRSPSPIETDTALKVLTVLEQAVYGVLERNRLEGHSDVVWGVSFAPKGREIATASFDKSVKLWHPDGRLLATFSGHEDSVTSVDVAPDALIASSSWDGTVRLWQWEEGPEGTVRKKGERVLTHGGRVYNVGFRDDGQALLSTGSDGTVKVWTRQGQLSKVLSGHQGEVNWAAFSPDGRTIASVGEDGTLRLWTAAGKPIKVLQGHQKPINYVAFNPQGNLMVTASEDRTIKLWNRDGQLLKTLIGHESNVHAAIFSPDGRKIASASNDDTVKLWTIEGQSLQTLRGHSDSVTGVSFSPDGLTLVSSSYDKTIKLWALENRSRVVLRGHQGSVQDVSFSADGQLVATASKDKTAKLWRRDGKLLTTLTGHQDTVYSVQFSPDGQKLVTASRDKTIKLWTRQGKLLKTLSGHQDWVLDLAWSPDSQFFASASRDRTVKLWSCDGLLLETLQGHRDRVNAVAFSGDGRFLASASDDKTVKLWQMDREGQFSKNPIQTLKGHRNWVLDVDFFPQAEGDLPKLASASYDNTVKLWKTQGKTAYTLKGHTDSVARLSFNPTGEILATATWSNQIQLWRLDDTLMKTLEGHSDRVTGVSWSQDGKAIATASEDSTAIIWNLDGEQLTTMACDWLQDYVNHSSEVRNSERFLCPKS